MKVSFVKRSGNSDQMVVQRETGTEVVDCPKQRIIPHDMVHYAVERTLHKRGFMGRVRDGEGATVPMAAEPESDGVERLVEVFQGDAWSGGASPPADLLALYEVTCSARRCPPLRITPADVLAVRECIADLDRRWQALPIGQALDLEM